MLESEFAGTAVSRTLPILLGLLRPYRSNVAFLAGLAVLQAALAAASPWLVGVVIDRDIPAARGGDVWPLIRVALALIACALGSALLNWRWRLRAGEIGQQVVFDLRRDMFANLQRLSVAFHERLSSGRVIARLTSDVESVNALFGTTLTGLLQSILRIAITTTAMLLLDIRLAGLVFGALAPLYLLTVWAVRRLRGAFAENRAAVAEMTVQVVESLNGVRAVQAFRAETSNDERFAGLVERARDSGRRIQIARGVYWPTTELAFALTAIAVVVVGGLRVLTGDLEVGVLAAFILYVAQFFDPITSLSFFLDTLQSALLALGKIAEVSEATADVPEPRHPVDPPKTMRGEVAFEGVTFAYETTSEGSSGKAAIPELELRLAPGQVVAMLGATGAGKSTIAKLLARFHDPTAGRVLLDGMDLRDFADRELRRRVTMLTQEGFLFAGSVADNIRLGRPGASMSEVIAAARSMGADDFIRALPNGYDTDVRKRGSRLSAGQRQLISLARAHLADPTVLILDEATSALDVPTERAMQIALRRLLFGRTALIIAHRLSTVELADRVLVVADGRIVDDGIPTDLLTRGSGEFAALYRDGHGRSFGRS